MCSHVTLPNETVHELCALAFSRCGQLRQIAASCAYELWETGNFFHAVIDGLYHEHRQALYRGEDHGLVDTGLETMDLNTYFKALRRGDIAADLSRSSVMKAHLERAREIEPPEVVETKILDFFLSLLAQNSGLYMFGCMASHEVEIGRNKLCWCMVPKELLEEEEGGVEEGGPAVPEQQMSGDLSEEADAEAEPEPAVGTGDTGVVGSDPGGAQPKPEDEWHTLMAEAAAAGTQSRCHQYPFALISHFQYVNSFQS